LYFKTSPISVRGEVKSTTHKNSNAQEFTFSLLKLFDYHGSDKGSNGYHSIYGEIFSKLDFSKPTVIAEIGLGSKNPRIPSNMGKSGKPGASLRAWRDISEKVKVYGLDVDRDALFTEARIETFFHDQTSVEDWHLLRKVIKPQSVDVFIDDGLHTPSANLCFLNNAFEFVKPGGYLIIEDIPERALPIWQLVIGQPGLDLKFEMFKGYHSYVLVIKKKK
jgi:SAM-dependent methyltransferase